MDGDIKLTGADLLQQLLIRARLAFAVCQNDGIDPGRGSNELLSVFPDEERHVRLRPLFPNEIDDGQRQHNIADAIGADEKDAADVQSEFLEYLLRYPELDRRERSAGRTKRIADFELPIAEYL